jgi:hypothetical protein
MIMRFRPANISLINRRHYLPRLPLTLSSIEKRDQRILTGHYISTSGLATNRPELRKLNTASGFGAHSIARRKLAVIAASRAELTSRKAA